MSVRLSLFDKPDALKVPVHTITMHQHPIQLIRFDLLHPEYGGNKWFKLKYNLQKALSEGRKTVISFGGPYSNHLYALAAVCRDYDLQAVGVIRGDAHYLSNECLNFCRSAGMALQFLSKTDYAHRMHSEFLNTLYARYPDAYIIPDGGDNDEGLKGASEMSMYIPENLTQLFISCGTFATISGILSKLSHHISVWGIPVLKAESWAAEVIHQQLQRLLKDGRDRSAQYQIATEYHFGGYAKVNAELKAFHSSLKIDYSIHTDLVYGAKLFYALDDMIRRNSFNELDRIGVIMCGRPSLGAES